MKKIETELEISLLTSEELNIKMQTAIAFGLSEEEKPFDCLINPDNGKIFTKQQAREIVAFISEFYSHPKADEFVEKYNAKKESERLKRGDTPEISQKS